MRYLKDEKFSENQSNNDSYHLLTPNSIATTKNNQQQPTTTNNNLTITNNHNHTMNQTEMGMKEARERIKKLEEENEKLRMENEKLKKANAITMERRHRLWTKLKKRNQDVREMSDERRFMMEEFKCINQWNERKMNELRDELKDKKREIGEINEKYVDLMEKGRKQDHQKFDDLLNDFRDLIENWDDFDFHGLIRKLFVINGKWKIKLNKMKYIIIGHFAKASEDVIKECMMILRKPGRRTPGLGELVDDFERGNWFGWKCKMNCMGNCGKENCGGYAKRLMGEWRDQRNMMIHRKEEEEKEWKDPIRLKIMVLELEKIIRGFRRNMIGLNDCDNDHVRVFGH